jgi:hypothetical protein
MKIEITDTQFHTLERILDNVRKGSQQASFPVDAVRALVRDHVTLYQAATGPVHKGGKGHVVVPGEDQRSLQRD